MSRENLTLTDAIKRALPFAGAVLAGGAAHAQQADPAASDDGRLDEVVVSATKRTESLQDVPLSIQAIGESQLKELHVAEFGDYVKFLPNVSYQSFGPGLSRPYMRGVASGENANHSGPLPSVGIYLDEEPITTIQGPLDVQVYDIARVEVLAGPQGTLYGASSQAGTIRIITNKPNPDAFDAAVELTGSTMESDLGYVAQGFVNLPLGERAAVRLVAWGTHTPGYIDNVRSSRVFPSSGIALDNSDFVEDNYNDVSKFGARAALRIDLNESWTITPTVMHQKTDSNGAFGFDPGVGDLEVAHGLPEGGTDKWTQAALTVQGKIGSWDITYAGAHLRRDVDTNQDYADYAFFYDTCCQYGEFMYDDDGTLIDPSQFIVGNDSYGKQSHELRFTSPAEHRVRATLGVFTQRQSHGIRQSYRVANLTSLLEVPGNPDTLWLTDQERTDRDDALFGEVTVDVSKSVALTAGVRFFEADNSLEGFFGYGAGYSSGTGEAACFDQSDFRRAPCINLDKNTQEDGNTKKLNVSWKATDDVMLYATWSEGFRPGGINRRGTLPPYQADFLTNYEVGFKTTWADNRLRLNGAIFQGDWEDFQYSFLGQSGLTEIRNAGQARIRGIEADLVWAATGALTLSTALSFIDAKTTEDYCGTTFPNGDPVTSCPGPTDPPDPALPPGSYLQAPSGQVLPVQPKLKGNAVARYEFPWGGNSGFAQLAVVHQGAAWSDLRTAERELVGRQPSYTIVDLSTGYATDGYGIQLFLKNAFDERAEIARYTECSIFQPGTQNTVPLCGLQPYTVTNQPRTIGVTFTKSF